jgi:hypothetical protein
VAASEASLRAAAAAADADPGVDVLELSPGATYELTCAGGGELAFADGVRIVGQGTTIRQTCPGERVLRQLGEFNAIVVEGVTIAGGDTDGDGGGIESEGGVVVVRSSIVDNRNGAIDAEGDVFVNESTISGNQHSDGGIVGSHHGTLTAVNTTVTGNSAPGSYVLYGDDGVVLSHVTIVANTASESVGSWNTGGSETPSLDAFASVIGAPAGGQACEIAAEPTSHGWNLDGDGTCGLTGPNDLETGVDPELGALGGNGGPSATMAPLASSPLLDAVPLARCGAGPVSDVERDQRGVARPQGEGCDVGAVELVVAGPVEPPAGDDDGVVVTPTFTG